MGLLLGASFITLFEFLDLLFYNAIAKCCRKRYKALEQRRDAEIARLTRLDHRGYQTVNGDDGYDGSASSKRDDRLGYNGCNV